MLLQPIDIAHGASAMGAIVCMIFHRVRHVASALAIFIAANILFECGTGWQIKHALAFVGPIVTLVSVALTVGMPHAWTAITTAPLVVLGGAAVARGQLIGTSGVAWCLVIANAYAATAGLLLLRIGARQVHRFHAGIAGLVLATCAPAAMGWTLRACGHSMQSASILDCVFFVAIVVASVAEWIRRWKSLSSPQSSVQPSHH
jgi:hypothetical protein